MAFQSGAPRRPKASALPATALAVIARIARLAQRWTVGLRAQPGAILGGFALVVAGALVVLTAPNWFLVACAGLAVLLLGTDQRFGYLGAGLLVLVALPFGRGADVGLLTIADVPIRAQDAVVAAALLAAAVRVARAAPHSALPRLRRMPGPLLLFFLLLGVVALVIGIERGNAARDIARDVRWWALYLAGLLAIMGGASRTQVLRGLLIGATFVCVLIIVAALLPQFGGGLKDQELQYDRGVLRMQFNNTTFVVIAAAYATWAAVRRGRWYSGWLVILVIGVVLSLTRTAIGVMAAAMALSAAVTVLTHARSRDTRRGRTVRAGSTVLLGLGLGMVLGIAINVAGTPSKQGNVAESIANRLTFQSQGVDSLQKGRFPTYTNALEEISRSPVLGRGLGSLVRVDYAYNDVRSSTIGYLPSVDDAYLTVWLKVGIVGLAGFLALLLWPIWAALRRPAARRLRQWFVPAWLGILVICLTQAFGASGYGVLAASLLFVLPALSPLSRTR